MTDLRSPETALWRAVIAQALVDMRRDPHGYARKETLQARDEARAWFWRGGASYRRACEWAGLDPDYVRQRALREMG